MNTRWLVKNWFRVGFNISWKLSFETLVSLLYFVPVFKNDFIYNIVQKKHKYVLTYLSNHFGYLIEKYKTYNPEKKVPEHNYIWTMWWQGLDSAPDLVKMCINSIKKNSNGAEVVVITKDNYLSYADIPDYIIEKHKSGNISFAQLSDIMRVFLISRHGGLWLDSTIFVSQPIPSSIFSKEFFSLHTPLIKTPFVQNDRIHCFVLGGVKGSKPIAFEKELLSDYWKNHDVIIDYYLLDYSFMLQYYNLPYFKNMVDSLDYIGEGMYDLVAILDQPFDSEKISKILSENIFSKLIWNQKHLDKRDTNYHYLLDQYLTL